MRTDRKPSPATCACGSRHRESFSPGRSTRRGSPIQPSLPKSKCALSPRMQTSRVSSSNIAISNRSARKAAQPCAPAWTAAGLVFSNCSKPQRRRDHESKNFRTDRDGRGLRDVYTAGRYRGRTRGGDWIVSERLCNQGSGSYRGRSRSSVCRADPAAELVEFAAHLLAKRCKSISRCECRRLHERRLRQVVPCCGWDAVRPRRTSEALRGDGNSDEAGQVGAPRDRTQRPC